MYSSYKQVARSLFVAVAILMCAAAFSFVAPQGVAYADLDFGDSAEWGDCCYGGDEGGDCCYGGDTGGDCCWGGDMGDCCWGGDAGDCCIDYGGDCCWGGDSGDCCIDDGGDCCWGGDDCCGDVNECCYDDDYCDDYCYTGDYGETYYSSSHYSSYTPSFSYPRSYSNPVTPITVSSGRSYVQPQPVYTTPSYTTNTTVIDNSINDSFNTNIVNYNSNNVGSFNAQAVSGGTGTAVAAISVADTVSLVALATPQTTVQYTYPTYTQPAPYCTISISNQYGVGYGNGQATLTWNATNATSATINPYIGSVSTSGSRIVYPSGSQVYTMTVYGAGGSATCQTQAYYITPPVVTSAPYVALSQIPYTGFDFGLVGNAIYWMSLLSFALAGGYLLVYYKGGMVAFAGMSRRDMAPARRLPTLPVSMFSNEVKEAKASDIRTTIDSMIFSNAGISINRG